MLVYCIKNKINDKEYIGLTKRPLESRWKQHVYESNKVNSWEWNTPLGNAIKKYGKDNFEIYVLNNYNSVEEMKLGEIKMIEERKSLSVFGGYNLSKGGDGRLGVKLSDETKRKIGLGQIGKIMSPEAKIKMSLAKRGLYKRGKHPKAVKLLVDGKERFECIRDFSDTYSIPASTVNNKLRQGLVDFVLKGIKIQRIYE
jgi:group I intron endonuclease